MTTVCRKVFTTGMLGATIVIGYAASSPAEAKNYKEQLIAEYPTGRFDLNGRSIEHQMLLVAKGPDNLTREVNTYIQRTLDEAFAAGLVAFEATPGEIGARTSAAFTAFKGVIIKHAQKDAVFKYALDQCGLGLEERDEKSDTARIKVVNLARQFDEQLLNRLAVAVPAWRDQIEKVKPLPAVRGPDIDLSVNSVEITNKTRAAIQGVTTDLSSRAQKGFETAQQTTAHNTQETERRARQAAQEAERRTRDELQETERRARQVAEKIVQVLPHTNLW
jgi:hypothetical protein